MIFHLQVIILFHAVGKVHHTRLALTLRLWNELRHLGIGADWANFGEAVMAAGPLATLHLLMPVVKDLIADFAVLKHVHLVFKS